MQIRDVLRRRTDLSTFLVHLTRDKDGTNAKDNLKAILTERAVAAMSPFGQAIAKLKLEQRESQKCVCFTETPLEHINLLFNEIEDRQYHFQPYGIAITKKQGRTRGVNPVWYIDMSTGPSGEQRDFLTNPLNRLINAATKSDFAKSDIAKLTPFIEQMFTHSASQKEFWWEREWRHCGTFTLPSPPDTILGLCPEKEIPEFEQLITPPDGEIPMLPRLKAKFIDPRWGLEEIIGRLAGMPASSIDLVR